MKWLLLGSSGQLGMSIQDVFKDSTHQIIPIKRQACDLTESASIQVQLRDYDFDGIINAAAYTAVDKAEDEAILAYTINTAAVAELAALCNQRQTPFLHISTDYVFDGEKNAAYLETDSTNPQNIYGKSKLAGETILLDNNPKSLILRVSWLFSKYGSNFVRTMLRLAQSRETISVVADQRGCPTAAKDVARVLLLIAEQCKNKDFDNWGLYHYCGKEPTNWYLFTETIFKIARSQRIPLGLKELQAITTEQYPTKAYRPKNSVLNCQKIQDIFQIHQHSWLDYLPDVIESLNHESLISAN